MCVVGGRGFGVPIVLGHEDGRQVPDRRQVHALKRRALVRGAIANEGHANLPRALHLCRQRRAADQRRSAAHNPVGAHHPGVQVRDMHRSALAATAARGPAIDLRHHRRHVHPFRDAMPVPAMRGRNPIGVRQMQHHAHRARLFTSVEMHKALNLTGCEFDVHPLLKLADRPHQPICLEQIVLRQCHRLVLWRTIRRNRRSPSARRPARLTLRLRPPAKVLQSSCGQATSTNVPAPTRPSSLRHPGVPVLSS